MEKEKKQRKKRTVHIIKECPQCGKTFSRSPSLARTKFCSKACYILKGGSRERRDIECERCSKVFNTTMDHGVWPKFCSRECFLSGCIRSEKRTCPICTKEFKSIRSTGTGELKVFCSGKCAGIANRRKIKIPCFNCSTIIEVHLSRIKNRGLIFCSRDCTTKGMRGEDHPSWKGSYIDSYTCHKMIHTENGWIGEHRLVAGDILKRVLRYSDEPIIHLNGNNSDNRPENLYIFHSREDMGTVINTGPLPKTSNLSPLTYE